MIEINDKYAISSDAFSFCVKEKIKTKKGDYRWKDIAWFGNLKQLKSFLMEKEIREDLSILENVSMCIALSEKVDELMGDSDIWY